MPTFRVEQNGQIFEIEVEEGQNPNEVLTQALGQAPAQPAQEPVQDEGRSLADEAVRGAGLGARAVIGAVPRTAGALSDLTAQALNLGLTGVDELAELAGGNVDFRFADNAVEQINRGLSAVGLPEPETLAERAVDIGGEALFTGGAGAARLAASRVPAIRNVREIIANAGGDVRQRLADEVAAVPAGVRPGAAAPEGFTEAPRTLADEIALTFANRPVLTGAGEFTAGAGAQAGGEVAAELDGSPAVQTGGALVGGVLGALAPTASGVNLAARAGRRVADSVPGLAPERRAATRLQEAAADPDAAAQAALDAPEGVRPARATDDANLQAIDERVLEDDPRLRLAADEGLEAAEERTVTDLAQQFGPETDLREWQQTVIRRASPEGAEIPRGQPDEMASTAFQEFRTAYSEAEGFPIDTRLVSAEPGVVERPLPESFVRAVNDPEVLADERIRERTLKWLSGRFDALAARGEDIAEGGVFRVNSEDMLELRHAVRKKLRQRRRTAAGNPDAEAEAEILENANDAITEALESQLPENVSAQLRATDARYREFKVVEDAIKRSGDKGLTATSLRSAIASQRSTGQVARGDTGPLGLLAEQGADVKAILRPSGTVDQAERLVRRMTPEQQQQTKASFNAELMNRAETNGRLKGSKYLGQIEKNREKLQAAGWTEADFTRAERIGKQLEMIQRRPPSAVANLLEDNVGSVMRLVAAAAGSVGASNLLRRVTGSAGRGAGPSLIVSNFGSRNMQSVLTRLSVDKADALLRAAVNDKELFAALLTRPRDPIQKQATAARRINAFLLQLEPDNEEN